MPAKRGWTRSVCQYVSISREVVAGIPSRAHNACGHRHMTASAPWRMVAGACGLVGAGVCGLVGADACGLVGAGVCGLTGTGVGEPSEPAALLHCLRQTGADVKVSPDHAAPMACTRGTPLRRPPLPVFAPYTA